MFLFLFGFSPNIRHGDRLIVFGSSPRLIPNCLSPCQKEVLTFKLYCFQGWLSFVEASFNFCFFVCQIAWNQDERIGRRNVRVLLVTCSPPGPVSARHSRQFAGPGKRTSVASKPDLWRVGRWQVNWRTDWRKSDLQETRRGRPRGTDCEVTFAQQSAFHRYHMICV